jgi:Ni,Fe-hydrogenase III large subunit
VRPGFGIEAEVKGHVCRIELCELERIQDRLP